LTDDDASHLFAQRPDPSRILGNAFARSTHFGSRRTLLLEDLRASGRGFLIHLAQILPDDIRD
jgi:hypothetical protein